jgi:hypothetical protein
VHTHGKSPQRQQGLTAGGVAPSFPPLRRRVGATSPFAVLLSQGAAPSH